MDRIVGMTAAILFVGAAVGMVGSSFVSAQTKGKKRPLTTSQMMAGLIKPKYVELKDGLAKEEMTPEDWKALATHAALLNESSHMLMADGRCPDETWADSSKILRKATAEILNSIKKEDAETARTAFEQVSASCKKCHEAFKYNK